MSKSRRTPRSRIYLVLALSLVLAIGYVTFRYLYPPQPSGIMAITPIDLTYGNTTVTGILQKDSPAGKSGTYLLILPDMRVIRLDVTGIDNLLGFSVSISGILSPAPDSTRTMFMIVHTITITE